MGAAFKWLFKKLCGQLIRKFGGKIGKEIYDFIEGSDQYTEEEYQKALEDYWREQGYLYDRQNGHLTPLNDSAKPTSLINCNPVFAECRSLFTAGKYAGSPIILDLDKDGVETTALTSGTYFDHDANGFSEQTGWASSDDGLLVMDRDADGLIEDGTELFGNNTLLADGTHASNGFQALAELDTNTDGKIDANDTAYSQLKVWQDIDEDGYTSEGEPHSFRLLFSV